MRYRTGSRGARQIVGRRVDISGAICWHNCGPCGISYVHAIGGEVRNNRCPQCGGASREWLARMADLEDGCSVSARNPELFERKDEAK